MSEVSVDTDIINKALSLCNSSIDELTKAKTELKEAKQKLNASWKDSKRKEFDAIIEKCDGSITKPLSDLQSCAAKLNEMLEALAEYEKIGFGRRVWNRVRETVTGKIRSEIPDFGTRPTFQSVIGGICWGVTAASMWGISYATRNSLGINSLASSVLTRADPSLREASGNQSTIRGMAYQWGRTHGADILSGSALSVALSTSQPTARNRPPTEQRLEIPMPQGYDILNGEHQFVTMESTDGRPMTVEFWVDTN